MKALAFLRPLGAWQSSVVHPRLDQVPTHVETSIGHIHASGFENRSAVLANWIVAFIGRRRPQRPIAAQQVFAREAFEAHAAGTVSKGDM